MLISLNNRLKTIALASFPIPIKMLQEELVKNPEVKPLIFVLSDGETKEGHSLDEIRGLIENYKIPIYTIGYNANLEALESISSINEAANINADTDEVVYKIGNLLNVRNFGYYYFTRQGF